MGRLADIATLPPTNPVAIQKGAQPLTPETSTNLTLGAVFGLGPADITLDYYNIQIEDRVAFTSRFNLTEGDIEALLAARRFRRNQLHLGALLYESAGREGFRRGRRRHGSL